MLSNIIHWDEKAQTNDPSYPHSKKNIQIFLFGALAYIFTAGFLYSNQYQTLVNSLFFLQAMRDFFFYFIFLDVITCFIKYKLFWGYGLLTELDGIIETKKKSVEQVFSKPSSFVDIDSHIKKEINTVSRQENLSIEKELNAEISESLENSKEGLH